MSILGNRVIRKEDPHLLTGGGQYVDNVPLAGSRYVTFVRSSMPHARILSIDVDEAASAPGVEAVFTADDLGFGPMPAPNFFPNIDQRFYRWLLAKDVVRFVGEPVVAIVASNRYLGADAAELVIVDYDPLPVVADIATSRKEETLLFPDIGTNVVAELMVPAPDDLFDGADIVVKQSMINRRISPAPLEGRSCAATWDGERLTYHASTQGVSATKGGLAALMQLEPDAVRVIGQDIGGGFGAKGGISNEEIVTAKIAMLLGGTVRWTETRSENLLAMGHGRGQEQTVEIGATNDGRIVGLHMYIDQEAGAYADIGSGLPGMTFLMSSGVYAIPKIAYTSRSWLSNTTPVGAFRGAGRPEAAYALERTLDVLATRLGIDPAELRRRNFIANDAFPVTTAAGTVYDIGNYEESLDRTLRAAGYDDLRAEQAARRASGSRKQLGIGMSTYVEITGAMPGAEPAKVQVNADGSATVWTGSTPHGQGHVTSWAMVASDRLGIPFDRINVLFGDTDRDPAGGVVGGSRSAQVCGVVVSRASLQIVDAAKEIAATLLEASPDDIILDTERGAFHVAGAPSISRSWTEVTDASGGPMAAEDSFEASSPTFPFGTNLSVVEVDLDTGQVELLRLVGCDDAGTVLNPLIFEGQLHGGMAAGVAQALVEEIIYGEDGNPLTSNFADYGAISAAELPSFELIHMETPTPINELGAKGIGESGTVGATPCVINAVVDALSYLGVEHLDMPASPQRVWNALASVGA